MVKSWPPVVQREAYILTRSLWKHKHVPIWWRDRVMSPILKKPGESSLTNLRPIGLLEVSRKILTRIITHRILTVWEEQKVLHPSQHGYRWRNGTDTAILRVLAAAEEARRKGDQHICTLWDFKKAFDSIAPNLMRLAWARLGVPDDVVDWFGNLDAGGLTFPWTPFMANNIEPRSLLDLLSADGHFIALFSLGFEAERGITQGGTESTCAWVALYDILLTWLDIELSTTSPTLPTIQLTTPTTGEIKISFADDLNTIAKSIHAAQLIAQQISAFCVLSGMELSIPKVVCTVFPILQDSNKSSDPIGYIILYDWSWRPHPVPIQTSLESIHYLGADLPLTITDKASHDWCLKYLKVVTTHLGIKQASAGCKVMVIETQIIPTLLYRATKASWPLHWYREIDAACATLYRKALSLGPGYPTELIYLSLKHNGLGMKRFSDSAQEQKWGSLQRAITLGGEAGQAAHFLLTQTTEPQPQYHHYVLSLREWGTELGLTLQEPEPPEPQDEHMLTNLKQELGLNSVQPDTFKAIFTDGSYTASALSTRRLTHVNPRTRWTHRGGAAVVYLPPENAWEDGTTIILRLDTPFRDVPGLDSYAYELIGTAMGLILSTRIPEHIRSHTDCQAVCTRTEEALSTRRRALGHRAKGVLLESIAASRDCKRQVTWVRSHPERRTTDETEWTFEDKGIYIADAVAGEDWHEVDRILGKNNYTVCTIAIDSAIERLLTAGLWHWRLHSTRRPYYSSPLLTDFQDLCDLRTLENYTSTRDQRYGNNPDRAPGYWTNSGVHLPRKLAQADGSASKDKLSSNLRQRILNTALTWDKSFCIGRNRAKTKQGLDLTKAACSDCGFRLDSLKHMCLDCTHESITQIRETAFQSHKNVLHEIQRTQTLPNWITSALRRLSSRAWNPSIPQVERYWTGTITAAQLETVFGDDIHNHLTAHSLRNLETVVINLLQPLYTAAKLMLQDRGCRYITMSKRPPRLLPRPRPKRSQSRQRPRVLRLLGVQRRPPTAYPTPDTRAHLTGPTRQSTGLPRPPQRRRLRQLYLHPRPHRSTVTHTTNPTPPPNNPHHSQPTHLELGALRTLIQNAEPPPKPMETHPKGRPPDQKRR